MAVCAAALSIGCAPVADDLPEHGYQTFGGGNVIVPPPVVACGGSTSEAKPVTLTWLDPDDSTLTAGAALKLSNTTNQLVAVRVESQLNGANGSFPLPDQQVTLAPAGTTIVYIDPSQVASAVNQEASPLTALVEAVVDDTSICAELRYLHGLSPQSSVFRWYSEQYLEQYSSAALLSAVGQSGTLPTEAEEDLLGTIQMVSAGHSMTGPNTIQGTPSTLPELEAALASSGGSNGGAQQTVCFWLTADYAQGGVDFAQDEPGYNNVRHPANGTKIWISVPGVDTFFGQTPRTGSPCVSFPALSAGSDFYMGMYFEAHLGNNPSRDIRVRSFDVAGSPWQFVSNIQPEHVPRNAYHLVSQGAGSVVDVATHPGNWRLANLQAVAIRQVAFYDAELGGAGAFSDAINVRAEPCPHYPNNVSCALGSQVFIREYDHGPFSAELIGHELGHVAANLYMSHAIPYDYGVEADDPACGGFGEEHALESKEWATTALNEGLASALGAFALSTSSSWKYYKTIPASGGIYHSQVINMYDAASYDHLHTACSTGGTDGYGVEADWLRFLWDYRQFSGISLATLFDRLGTAASAMNNMNAFGQLRSATPAAERAFLEQRAWLFGIYTAT